MTRTVWKPRTYTPAERAEAVALAASIGPKRAAERLGLPPRTVAYWTHQPAAAPIIARAEQTIADRLASAHEEALSAVMDGLRDPHAKLGDRASALRVLGEQRALAEGRATANIATSTIASPSVELDDEERRQLADFIHFIGTATDDDLRAYLAAHGIELLRGLSAGGPPDV